MGKKKIIFLKIEKQLSRDPFGGHVYDDDKIDANPLHFNIYAS